MNAPAAGFPVTRALKPDDALTRASMLAVLLPAVLLGGALASQHLGGLVPCEMCLWQRWPHYAALVLAMVAFAVSPLRRPLTILAGLAIAVSGAIGVFHAGVEYHWWEGITACTSPLGNGGGDVLATILAAPVIRCDVAQWTLAGISLAGFNAILSLGGAGVILWQATRGRA